MQDVSEPHHHTNTTDAWLHNAFKIRNLSDEIRKSARRDEDGTRPPRASLWHYEVSFFRQRQAADRDGRASILMVCRIDARPMLAAACELPWFTFRDAY